MTAVNAACAVCGHRPDGEVVHCAACEGVYHRECWMFFGSCSRYGCGSVTFAGGFPDLAESSLVIDGTASAPPPAAAPARAGDGDHVQLGLVVRETDYGQALTVLNRNRIRFRTETPRSSDGRAFAAWLYVPYPEYAHARGLLEDHQIPVEFTPLSRRQDLVNYPWALAACAATALLAPAYVAPLSLFALVAIGGRDLKDRAALAWKRFTVKRRPVLPPGKDAVD